MVCIVSKIDHSRARSNNASIRLHSCAVVLAVASQLLFKRLERVSPCSDRVLIDSSQRHREIFPVFAFPESPSHFSPKSCNPRIRAKNFSDFSDFFSSIFLKTTTVDKTELMLANYDKLADCGLAET